MLHIAACDDDSATIEKLEGYFDSVSHMPFDYDVFFSAEELCQYKQSENMHYDIYFLDIEMKGMNGLELASLIRQDEPHALLIFLTNYDKYVYDVFEVVTFDFLLKPITFEKFCGVLEKALSYLAVAKETFTFCYRKNSFSIPMDEIIYFEKIGRKVFLHTTKDIYQFNMT